MAPLDLSREDLSPFADLGTSVEMDEASFRFTREGNQLQVDREGEGYVLTETTGMVQRLPDARQLLAHPAFADLRKIARNQVVLLNSQRISGDPIPIRTSIDVTFGASPAFPTDVAPWRALDNWLCAWQASQSVSATDLLLIDGPAGVGKTTIVQEAALLRAESYDGTAPLILQIASRGRVLQNIADLIAFALQDVRSGLTVGQLMPLMRHGLVILAIDGFDELSDPNGFETAWSGLNNLLSGARGRATFLLAGRETFVSTDTMRRQMNTVNPDQGDRLVTLSLSDPDPAEARAWLLRRDGWSPEILKEDFVEPLFEQDSYALRPFFLDVISREPAALTNDAHPASDLLSYLVSVMTRREAMKFVDSLDPPNGIEAASVYEAYVGRFLEEVARDMAENQAEEMAEDALDLLATVAADGLLPSDQVRAVVQRARTVVFLANDLQAGHIRFAHEQLLQHFLAREALRSVGQGETPRYIRRNLFGREALEIFAHVARERENEATRFLVAVREGLGRPSRDRTHTNLSVLGVAAMCATAPEGEQLRVQDVGINELHFPFSAPPGIVFRGTPISILHAKRADIRNVTFEDGVYISTLEIDHRSRVPKTMPTPQTLVYPGGTTGDQEEIASILAPTPNVAGTELELPWSEAVADLLGRIDRYRPFWLRTRLDETDRQGRRIIAHPEWQQVYDALRDLDLVTVRSRDASGVRSDFVHFRQGNEMLRSAELYRMLTE